ncbi:hemerythrin domain-containing protein [Amycolatopsis orientalis]|uniref:hemerythrin domain-containing protein n=1 Tax=Amycolatopsis orientalis TaxID=31958 RepID=UPI0005613B92|nr:hemerythrin domain-containing protein [Amycolatopsis orientalis]
MTTTTKHDLISVITEDHRAFERIFKELESGKGGDAHRKDLADHLIAELVRHSIAEEQHMYPAARRHLPDGDEVADHEIEEHSKAERIMKDLEGLEPKDNRFDELVGKLIEDVRHHIEEEEGDLLPKLQGACSAEELRDLGEKILRAKKIAPTRPHPAAPDRPPANRILAPGTAFIDKIRDALEDRNT